MYLSSNWGSPTFGGLTFLSELVEVGAVDGGRVVWARYYLASASISSAPSPYSRSLISYSSRRSLTILSNICLSSSIKIANFFAKRSRQPWIYQAKGALLFTFTIRSSIFSTGLVTAPWSAARVFLDRVSSGLFYHQSGQELRSISFASQKICSW